MNAIVLCRISDKKQEDGYSLEAQEKYAREYCEKEKLKIEKVFSFVETASKVKKRVKYSEMFHFLKKLMKRSKGPIHLVVEKPDRLTRNLTHKEELEEYVLSGHLIIHYYKDRRVVDKNASPADIFADDMFASVSKYIAKNIGRETLKGLKQKAENGWKPGPAPIGYKNIREGRKDKHDRKEATIAVDENTKDAVLRIFELRAVYNLSLNEIKQKIITEKLLPIEKISKLNKATIDKILKNKFYAGILEYGGEVYQGKHEVFVPKKWFMAAQEITRPGGKAVPTGAFNNFLKCADSECKCSILYDPKTKTIKKTGEVKIYHYYHCSDGKGVHKNSNEKQINVSEAHLWEEFAKPVREIQISEDFAKLVSEELKRSHLKALGSRKIQLEKIKQSVTASEQEEDALVDLFVSRRLDEETFNRKLKRIKDERTRLQNLADELIEDSTAEFTATKDKILELAKNAELLWNTRNSDEKKNLLKLILSNQELDKATLQYSLKKPFQKLSEMRGDKDWCLGRDSNSHTLAGGGF